MNKKAILKILIAIAVYLFLAVLFSLIGIMDFYNSDLVAFVLLFVLYFIIPIIITIVLLSKKKDKNIIKIVKFLFLFVFLFLVLQILLYFNINIIKKIRHKFDLDQCWGCTVGKSRSMYDSMDG